MTPREYTIELLKKALELLEAKEGFGKVLVLVGEAVRIMGNTYAMGDQ